ncbi:Noranthrone synthase [Escovopsis weberi]|uniref:Noranthrone synthase n=1 Tax=Escovopsis weberi TaxID=150374 RepID=A0A0M8MYM4_ESCWE|nr:Noranthrone synthase [Escovopsis weberi]
MVGEFELYLFGDQTFEIQPQIKDLLKHRDNPLLADFLVRAYGVLGLFIVHTGSLNLDATRSRCLGLCTGALAAAVTLPFNSRPYVSAYAPNGVTVSGPPASLAKLVASDDFKGITHKSIPIHGPYHAPHLFSQRDVEDILSGLPAVGTAQKSEQISLFSSTGVRAQNRQFAALLEAAVRQILVEPIPYEAIEQAGLVPDATPSTRRDRVGVFYGVTSNDWMETNSAQNIDTYFIPGGNRAFIPGRINYFFKFSGPSYAVDTACSSSLAGIHLACNSLWRGDVDTAIAGGTNVLTNPDFTAGLDRGHFLSRTGNCKTFDDGADGYCRGEGIGTVIIKRLDDAIAERDPILGIILGAYTNHSAESESITRPHVGAQRAIFRKILNQGAVDPYTVSYVEMHGTGTQAGDAGEMSSVLDTFAPPLSQVKRARTKDEALYLGSAKANIGHGEAASGVSSLIKVLLMMQKNLIPPHCGIKNKINHKFPTDLQERNVNIALCPISEALCSQINAALQESLGMTRPKSAPKVVFAFTGQGAQYAGMGKQLFESFSLFRREILHLDQMAIGMGFPSFLPVIESGEKEIGAFAPTEVQLAGVCLQIALGKLWMSWGITPGVVVGHSLGEYAALNVAGVLSDVDAIYLVGKRAQLLESKCTRDTHAMLVVKGSVEAIKEALGDREHEIACINSPVETVLAGPNEDIAALKGSLTAAGFKTTLLKVPYAFHSSQVDPILPEFLEVAGRVTYRQPRIAILCPLDGSVISDTDGQFGPSYLASHSRQPVNMRRALLMAQEKTLIGEQTVFLELGPHPAVTGMVKGTLGADIRWGEYQRDFVGSHKVINNLPAYSWDLKKYWMQYVHDWSLRKGDAPLISNGPKLESTTIHRVVKETSDAQRTHLVVEADITRKDLSPLVQGHEVDGIPLCTPSVYTDIALSLGNYVLQRYRPDQDETLIDVTQMDIFKALILREDALQQLLQAHADFEWSTRSAVIKFMSFDSKQQLQEHSRCILKYRDRSLQRELQGQAPVIQGKIQRLREGIASGITARFNRPMVYRAIRPLARFHDDYRAIDEIVLNSKTLEASSRLSFGSVKRGGDFHTNPAIIDSLTQSCGFTMNCNDGSDLDVEVFMNHGWGSFQMFEPMDFEKEYTTYTRMEEGPDKLWRGDVVIFDGDRVVAFFGQIAVRNSPSFHMSFFQDLRF